MFQGSLAEEHCQASHFYWNQKSQFHFRDKHKYSWGEKHDPPKMKKNDQSGQKSDLPEASAGSRRGRI